MPDFTHLHVHTQYSILDGAAKIDKLIDAAIKKGMNSLAITDHGNMYGALRFFLEAKNKNIKPIIGCEVYVAPESRFEQGSKDEKSSFHLILLAKNYEGYLNLSRLTSLGYLEGFYYRPRIDKELLRKYNKGIIAMSACLGGEIPAAILNYSIEKAEKKLLEYLEIFKDDFYLELMNHGMDDQVIVNKALVELSKKHNVKVVATNDVHYIEKEDAEAHDLLICLNTGKDLNDQDRMKYSGQEYLKSPEEMAALFPGTPEAITNTKEIVDKIEEYDIRREIILPVFPLPEGFEKEDDYLRHLTYEGAKKRYKEITDSIRKRLDYELSVISNMGYPGYFLIVQDLINEARNMGVLVGPGRGSAAGSAVAYCIGITNIDPIEYNLLFERFLNPERVSMPDIDIDFDDEGRDKVLDYVKQKYGTNRVAQIVTFGTMAARLAIRDVARVLRLPLPEADRLAKLVPDEAKMNLSKAYKDVKDLTDILKGRDTLSKKTLEFAETLEGSARHTGTHACGVIIGPDDLIDHVPLSTTADKQNESRLMVTQYEGKLVEAVGMLKMDFLGLKTLSIMKDAIRNIEKSHHVKIDIETIPLDDEKTFQLYQKGDTIGTFQFESEGMRQYLKDLKPTNLEDLIAMNALYRPGPMHFIPMYINRKYGREKVEYQHPLMEEILKPTYGIMVYQEQIMKVAQVMGGFTLGNADILRRAMGKKRMEIMEEQKVVFLEGAKEKNIEQAKAEEVWEVMKRFAEYGFNRSHSAAYSLIAYQTAYLKAHYPAEYLAAVLTHNLNDIKKINFFIEEAKRHDIPVLGPDVNESDLKFVVNDKGEIRFGLAAIKGLGESAAVSIVEEREKKPYESIFDFAKRVNSRSVNKRCYEALVKAGAFDCFKSIHRAQYFFREREDQTNLIEKVVKHASDVQNEMNGGLTLFGDEIEVVEPSIPECDIWTKLEQLQNEKEVTGIYISGHPLDDYKIEMDNFCNVRISELKENLNLFKNKDVVFAGIVNSAAHKVLANGNQYATFLVEDYSDTIQLPLFSNDYLRWKHLLEPGTFVIIKARVQQRYNMNNQLEIKINHFNLLSETINTFAKSITLKLHLQTVNDTLIDEMLDIVKKYKGKSSLNISVCDNESKTAVRMQSKKYKVNISNLVKVLEEIENVEYQIN